MGLHLRKFLDKIFKNQKSQKTIDVFHKLPFKILDSEAKECPRCNSRIKVHYTYCPWCGYNEKEGFNSDVINWKSEKDVYIEKKKQLLTFSFGPIDQYQYDLLYNIYKYSFINTEEIFSEYEKEEIKTLITKCFLIKYDLRDILLQYKISKLKPLAKSLKVKVSQKKENLINDILSQDINLLNEILQEDIEKYKTFYKLKDDIQDYFIELKKQEEKEKEEKEDNFITLLETSPENIELYSTLIKKTPPKILNFMDSEDYCYLIKLYVLEKNIRKWKIPAKYFEKPYKYNKFCWGDCLRIINSSELYLTYNGIERMKLNGIKKVKLICHENCTCCLNYKDKPILLSKIKELPITECESVTFCSGAGYVAVLDYDD